MAGFGCSPRHKTSPPFCDLRCRCFPAPASPERKTSNTRLGLAGRVSSDDPSTACRYADYRALTERFQNFLVVEAHTTSGLNERNTAEVYPVVERTFGNAEIGRAHV